MVSRSNEQIRVMRVRAQRAAGWDENGDRAWPAVGESADELAMERERAYAEGAEAALLWVLGDAGDPLPPN